MFKIILLSVGTIIIAILTLISVNIIDTGNRGVKTVYGKVEGESLPEGIYFVNPITSSITEMDVKTQVFSGDYETYTKDVQQAKISFTMNYNLQKDAAHIMYQEVGKDWEELLIPQVVSGNMKTVVGKWDAVELIANRGKAMRDVFDSIKASLADKHIVVTNFEITNIAYNDEFEGAVEAKQIAIQKASQAKNDTVRIQEEAEQRVITAKSEAEAMTIKSEALSKNSSLVSYEAVQKWDGKLPVYSLGGTVPFIQIPSN